jgi:hypothetical protein
METVLIFHVFDVNLLLFILVELEAKPFAYRAEHLPATCSPKTLSDEQYAQCLKRTRGSSLGMPKQVGQLSLCLMGCGNGSHFAWLHWDTRTVGTF